ncbi:MAG TPA: protease pro-enzyme activation domain-containing protein, partial [Pirellulales bacterium]|nr:protease pro-enzyme activation domain-containing protein [Pirellulales bacterium]
MNTNKLLLTFAVFSLVALFSIVALRTSSQATYSQPRITAAVNDAQLTVLRGNTYPLAQPQFDRGPAPASLPMQHMLLVLKRSPAQEAALESFMAEQLDASSPNYHHWLSPTEFGQTYGPAQQDINTITKWLGVHGFQVNSVSAGRTTIDFSGNAAQVQGAFHTAIHQYVIKNEQHWANSSDPSIPTALVPVVAGVRSLHNFFPKPQVRQRQVSARPNFSFNAGGPCDITQTNDTCFTVGPNDFATIYNVLPEWNNGIDGTGETIAIVADSNINLQDISQFRSLFSLPPKVPNVIVTNTDPGLNGDEIESALDTEWTGAVAKNAQIDLVVSSNTNSSAGIDLSAQYIINTGAHGLAPILSSSFGACEYALGTAGNQFYNTEWQQAASEGITVLVSAGDAGAASCDVPSPFNPPGCGFSSNALLQAAQCGLAVNGLASTPFNLAVGGTDFNDLGTQTLYWSTGNSAGETSALKYVPEDVWNDTCTNSNLFNLVSVSPPITTPVGSCSDLTLQDNDFVSVSGGGGGESNCTNDATTISACSGGNPQPTWQNGLAGVQGTKRNLPDVSLFAGTGLYGHFYVMCEMDSTGNGGQDGSACTLGASPDFTGVGGTSVGVQAFAGIMALVDQKNGNPAPGNGNAAPILYALAASQSNASCNSSAPASTCFFNDITVGTNSVPCTPGTVNCSTTASIPNVLGGPASPIVVRAIRIACALGIGLLLLLGLRRRQQRWVTAAALCGTAALLIVSVGCGGGGNSGTNPGNDNGTPEGVVSGFSAGTGYDLATGLGSINATNVVNSTMWVGVTPSTPPATIDRPTVTVPVATLAIAMAMFLGLLFVGLRRKQLRWTTAVLLLAFALSILSAA